MNTNRLSSPASTTTPRRSAGLLLALCVTITVAITGCGGDGSDGLSKAALSLGLSDAPALPAEILDVLCDASQDTPCSATTLAETFDRILPYAASRPGSHVRLWKVGRDVSDIFLLADQVSPPTPAKKKAVKSSRLRWVADVRRYLLKAAEPTLQERRVMRSPLLEAVTKVALAEIPGVSLRTIVFLTDGLEVSSYADWECAELVPVDVLRTRLHSEHVLSPGVLKDTRVSLSFTDMAHAPRNRCRSSIPRLTAIMDGWKQLLREAGASEVFITTGVGPIGERPTDEGGAK